MLKWAHPSLSDIKVPSDSVDLDSSVGKAGGFRIYTEGGNIKGVGSKPSEIV